MHFFTTGNIEESFGRANIGLQKQLDALANFLKAISLINQSGAGNTIWAAKIYQG